MSYSGGYRSSRAQVPVSSVLLTAAQEETTSNTYLFGKTQSFRGLGILSKCFAILVCIETFVVVGLASFRLYKMKFPLSFETRADFTFALLLLINTGFSAYYAIHGCLKERTKEIYAFLFASFIVTCHVCYQYFLQQDPSSEDLDVMFLRRLQFIAVLLFEPLNCVLGVLVAHSFGWISFKIVGADIAFSNMYANYCTFLSFLKVDVQSAVNFVLVNSLLSFVGYVELGFDIAGLIVSLLWAVGCWAAIRYEEPTLVYTTLSVSLLEPVYIIMKLAALLNAHQEHSPFVSRLPILLSGLFALLSRGAFLYSYTKCKRNFGKGLKARLVNNIDKTNREATPILGRTLRGARGYGSMTL